MRVNEKNISQASYPQKQHCLTNRQLQTILLSLNGETNKEMAKKISLSPRTIDDYWRDIHQKFREATGHPCTRSQIIEIFLKDAEQYLNPPDALGLSKELQAYRNSLLLIRKKIHDGSL